MLLLMWTSHVKTVAVNWKANRLHEFLWHCVIETVNVIGYQACWHSIKAGVSNDRYEGQISFAKGPRAKGSKP